jgi:tetratricopeptide (TPR) repeat protein
MNIGNLYRKMKDYDSALRNLENAERVFRTIHKEQCHPNLARTLFNIGCLYFDKGELSDALKYLLDAEKIFKIIYGGNNHPDLDLTKSSIDMVRQRIMMLNKH